MQSSGITLPHLQVKLAKICCRDVPIPKKYAVMFIGYVQGRIHTGATGANAPVKLSEMIAQSKLRD